MECSPTVDLFLRLRTDGLALISRLSCRSEATEGRPYGAPADLPLQTTIYRCADKKLPAKVLCKTML